MGQDPGGGYSHIQVCAAQQGMLFASLTLEQGIKKSPFLSHWKRVYFTKLGQTTLEQGRLSQNPD